jgi:DNA modification methylase
MVRPNRSKLRRNRPAAQGREILSVLPSAAQPASRIARGAEEELDRAGVLDLRSPESPLEIDQVENRILCGDAAAVLDLLPPGIAGCAITSPPYWNLVDYGYPGQIGGGSYEQYRQDLARVWRGVARALKPNGKFALNVPLMPLSKKVSAEHFGETHTRVLLDLYADLKTDVLRETDLQFFSLYIWEKQTTEKMFGSYPYPPNLYERNYIEFIAVFVKPGAPERAPAEAKARAKLSSDEWMELTKQVWWMYPENVSRDKGHPAPFPEALPNRLINMYSFPACQSFPGDLVLDPLCGWGTACVAARRLGRRYLGIDRSTRFCHEAARRCASVVPVRVVMRAQRPTRVVEPQLELYGDAAGSGR